MSSANSTAMPTIDLATDRPNHRYGWVMVLVGAWAMVATLPGRTHGMGMITERLLADPSFDLTRTGLGYLNLWATLIGALFCLGVGSLIDRFGLRFAIAAVMIPLGVSVLLMAKVSSVLLLFLAILAVRGFGQSALSVVSIASVGKWFPGKPSLPMAVYSVLLTIGFIAVTLVAREYAAADWRTVWAAIGVAILVSGALATCAAKDPPDAKRDADAGSVASSDDSVDHRETDYRLVEALRTPFFFVASFAIALYGMTISGMTLFNESILADQGFESSVYYDSLAIGAGVGILANLVAGGLGIRFAINRLLAVALFLVVASLVLLTRLNSYSDVMLHVILNATGGGMLTVLFFTVWPKLYGKTYLGSIQATAQMLTVIASALGPLLFAQSKDLSGSYFAVVMILALMLSLMAVASWFCPLPAVRGGVEDGS